MGLASRRSLLSVYIENIRIAIFFRGEVSVILAAFWIVNQDSTSQGVKIFFEVLCEEVFFRYLWVKKRANCEEKEVSGFD